MCVCVYVYVCIYIYICLCVCVCVCIHISVQWLVKPEGTGRVVDGVCGELGSADGSVYINLYIYVYK